jgi:hypothetical protein
MNLNNTQLSLTFDIWTEVVKYLDFRDLVSLRTLSSHLVGLEYRRRIKYVLRLWISEDCQKSFWRELRMGDGAICGSAVLKVLIPCLFVSPVTVLDVFVARDMGHDLKLFLFSIGYEVSNLAVPRPFMNRQVGKRWLLYNPQVRSSLIYDPFF